MRQTQYAGPLLPMRRQSKKRQRPLEPQPLSGITWTTICTFIIMPALVAAASDASAARTAAERTTRVLHHRRSHGGTGLLLLRGGGMVPEGKERLWSLGALFRLNAEAQDEALRQPSSDDTEASPEGQLMEKSKVLGDEHDEESLEPGNGRGGALAVKTRKEVYSGVVDTNRVLPDSSGLVELDNEDNEQGEDRVSTVSTRKDVLDSVDFADAVKEGAKEENKGIMKNETTISVEQETKTPAELSRQEEIYTGSTGQDEPEPALWNAVSDGPAEGVWWEENDQYYQSLTLTDRLDTNESRAVAPEEVENLSIVYDSGIESGEKARPEFVAKPTALSRIRNRIKVARRLRKMANVWWVNVWAEAEQVSDTPLASNVENRDVPDHAATEDRAKRDIAEPVNTTLSRVSKGDTKMKEQHTTVEEASLEDKVQAIELFDPLVSVPEFLAETVDDHEDMKMIVTPEQASEINMSSANQLSETEGRMQKSVRASAFVSSGYWKTIDKVLSLGYSSSHPSLRVSRHLRPVRKAFAHATGLHGLLSGKGRRHLALLAHPEMPGVDDTLDGKNLDLIRRRITIIEKAKQRVERKRAADADIVVMNRRGIFRRNRRRQNLAQEAVSGANIDIIDAAARKRSTEEFLEAQRRKERVKQIDRLISKGQAELLELQCEKDALQRRPNPLFNYTTTTIETTLAGTDKSETTVLHSRNFNFPPKELVEEYLDELFSHGRLVKMNHTHLWKNGGDLDDEEESIGDDLLTPSADARKLYEYKEDLPRRSEGGNRSANNGGGSWLLRQTLGKGGSLGEKIGEGAEAAAYRAVCAGVMETLARSISSLHGINVMRHSDVRLFVEDSPDLPPVGRAVLPGSSADKNYAQEAIMDAMARGMKKRVRKSRRSQPDEAFIQRDAVVETLISHCQISAPLLKLFPIAWQRALLGNMITLIAAIMSDFCDGIQLQILGHQLSLSFKPITESDMIRHIGLAGRGFNHRRARPEEFEAAVRATADDVSENLKFLDRWHERALGSGMLRAQIANLIARIVLTLTDEVLSGARMDLWAAQAGGPRMLAGLEYRTSPSPDNLM